MIGKASEISGLSVITIQIVLRSAFITIYTLQQLYRVITTLSESRKFAKNGTRPYFFANLMKNWWFTVESSKTLHNTFSCRFIVQRWFLHQILRRHRARRLMGGLMNCLSVDGCRQVPWHLYNHRCILNAKIV